jgi:hypothetical protein
MRIAVLVCLLLLAFPAIASANLRPDSAAPPGADASWLPSEEWVMERWSPFDTQRLSALLGNASVYEYLHRGAGNLKQLARSRGVPVKGLARRLVVPRKPSLSRSEYRVMLQRTERMLDQRHLAEHVIGHTFHHWSIWLRPEEIWGPQYRSLEEQGLSIPDISGHVDIDTATLRRMILERLDAAGRRGVAKHAMSAAQERLLHYMHHTWISELVPDTKAPSGAARRSAHAGASAPALLCAL